MNDATLIADLVRAGVDPELVGRVANAIASALLSGQSADKSADSPVDTAAERRRAYDRERQKIRRQSGGHPRTSAESANVALTKEDSRKESKSRAQRLSADWTPSAADIECALSKGMAQPKIGIEAVKFRNYWTAKSGRDATKLDWPATWENWVLSALERSGGPMPTAPPSLDLRAEISRPPWEREGITENAWRERELGKANGAQIRRNS